MCAESTFADIETKTVRELQAMNEGKGNGEHPDNWSDKNLQEIFGDAAPLGYDNPELLEGGMSDKLDRKRTQLVMMTALRHGIREASGILAKRGLKYGKSRISAMFKDSDKLSTVFISSEVEKCSNFTDFQKIFNKPIG